MARGDRCGDPAHVLRDVRVNAGVAAALPDRLHRRHGERRDLALSHYRGGPLPTGADGPAVRLRTVYYVAGVLEWQRHQDDAATKAPIADVREGAFAPRRAGAEKADVFPALVRSPFARSEHRGNGARARAWREPAGHAEGRGGAVARDSWSTRGRVAATGGARYFEPRDGSRFASFALPRFFRESVPEFGSYRGR